MFEVGEIVWVEYDPDEAFIGRLTAVTEDELTMVQLASKKTTYGMTEALERGSFDAVSELKLSDARAQLLGTIGIRALPYLLMGEGAIRVKLAEVLATGHAERGVMVAKMLEKPMTVVLPRMGAVVYDGVAKVNQLNGDPAEEEAAEPAEPTEEEVEAEVKSFSESIDSFEFPEEKKPEF